MTLDQLNEYLIWAHNDYHLAKEHYEADPNAENYSHLQHCRRVVAYLEERRPFVTKPARRIDQVVFSARSAALGYTEGPHARLQ